MTIGAGSETLTAPCCNSLQQRVEMVKAVPKSYYKCQCKNGKAALPKRAFNKKKAAEVRYVDDLD